MNCHQCGEIVTPSDNFCEGCGVDLVVKAAAPQLAKCQKCGAMPAQIDSDRYCSQCGFRQVEIQAEDAIELQPSPILAGVSDRGRRHERNEDAIALNSMLTQKNGQMNQLTDILVVCDGVSSSQHPELASLAAATAVLGYLENSLPPMTVPAQLMPGAMRTALQAVGKIPFDPDASEDPSSTTIVAAVVQANLATIAWLGDSRAYWLAEHQSQQLTEDDSWLREVVAAGEMTQTEAEQSPHAHAIVRWLGADVTEQDVQPSIITFKFPSAGYLLLCTDGLWNYVPNPTDLYNLIQQAQDTNPSIIARHLVRYANQQGGQDNITVGLLIVPDPQFPTEILDHGELI